jgi:hypothetical protein
MSEDNPDIKLNQDSGDSEADKEIMKRTNRFNKTESSRIKKAELHDDVNTQPVVKPKEDLTSGEDVLDPLTLRDSDTSKLKRIKPKSATQTINLDSENVSDTVHLKVIKEKKKQLAGILTASQTIRLRPPSSPQAPPGGPQSSQTLKINPSAPPAPSTPGAPQSAQTLKIAPGASSSGSGTVSMPPAGAPAGTLKINMPASTSESGTIKVSKPNFAEGSSAGTLKIKSPVAVDTGSTVGGTLKIKSAAASTASASGTLKLKAAGTADETVKIAGDDKGGTLKLKAKSTVSQPAGGTLKKKAARQREEDDDAALAVEDDPKAKPGIFMTLSSLVALAAIGTIVFMCIDNYMELFSIMNRQ